MSTSRDPWSRQLHRKYKGLRKQLESLESYCTALEYLETLRDFDYVEGEVVEYEGEEEIIEDRLTFLPGKKYRLSRQSRPIPEEELSI